MIAYNVRCNEVDRDEMKDIANNVDASLATSNEGIRLGLDKLFNGLLEEMYVLDHITRGASKGVENKASV